MLPQAVQRTLDERVDDELIEACGNDREARVANNEVAFGSLDPVHGCA